MDETHQQEHVEQLRYLLAHGRVQSALELVNQLSRYRFTAIYRIEDASLHNLVIVDRDSTSPPRLQPIPVEDSYCVHVRDRRDALLVADADRDARVADHPKRPVVKAYCGVPLKRIDGSVFGTICHFDFDPVTDDADATWWLSRVADYFDPAIASHSRVQEAQASADALEAMLDLLLETSDCADSARDAFDDFARPVHARLGSLPPDNALALEERLDRLRSSLPERFAKARIAAR